MNKATRRAIALSAVVLPLGASMQGCSKAVAQAKPDLKTAREDVTLTVYKENFAVVQEHRPVELGAGTTRLGITDVSKVLDQQSVIFSWPDKSTDAQIASSSYELGVQASEGLLKRYLGKQVDLVRYGDNGKESERIHGTLQVAEPNNVVIYSEGKYLINPEGSIEAPATGEITTIPQLSVQVSTAVAKKSTLGVTYLTQGLSWSSDYVMTLPQGSDKMKLECWATVTNTTGADYPNAKLTFVAGNPNRAVEDRGRDLTLSGGEAMRKPAAAPQKEFQMNGVYAPVASGELYSYPVKEAATISQDQMNRVRMLHSDAVTLKKDYSVRLDNDYSWYENGNNSTAGQRLNAVLAIRFNNDEKSGLGLPLPGGAVRVFEPDANGGMTYIGAATMSDTPKDTGAFLTLTNAFDVWAQGRTLRTKRLDKRNVQRDYEVLLHNSKATAVDLRVVKSFYGSWKMVSESAKSTRPDASNAQWIVNLPAGKEVTLKYSVKSNG